MAWPSQGIGYGAQNVYKPAAEQGGQACKSAKLVNGGQA